MLLAAWHNHKVRRLDPATGLVDGASRGNGPGFTGDGAPALRRAAEPAQGRRRRADRRRIYVADTRNFRIRRIDAGTGIIDDRRRRRDGRVRGRRRPARCRRCSTFQKPNDNPEPGGGLASTTQGRLYIADTDNHRIRRVDFAADTIETVAGNGTAGFSGDGGPATEAALS